MCAARVLRRKRLGKARGGLGMQQGSKDIDGSGQVRDRGEVSLWEIHNVRVSVSESVARHFEGGEAADKVVEGGGAGQGVACGRVPR